MTSLKILDEEFLSIRCKLIELAAVLDRIDRAGGVQDTRLDQIRAALGILASAAPNRAERVQMEFSSEEGLGIRD
jgi:hypothetical protein